MYTPKNLTMTPYLDELDFIRDHPLGLIISKQDEHTLPKLSYLPFIVGTRLKRPESNDNIISNTDQITHTSKFSLFCHIAKANRQWKTLNKQQVIISFLGPHAFIPANWYSTQPSVPTWNYAAVQVTAKALLLDEQQASLILAKTMSHFKQVEPESKHYQQFRQKLMQAIAFFEFSIEHIEGKLKLGQHRHLDDQTSIYQQLQQSNDRQANQLADFMMKIQCGIGGSVN